MCIRDSSSAEDLPFENDTFDVVSCLGSLEHFLNPEKALLEMKRVGTANCKLCIVVPNSKYIFYMLKNEYGTEQQEISETLRTLSEWKQLFTKAGFKIERISQDNWIRTNTPITLNKGLARFCKNVVKRAIWSVLPLRYTYQFVFVLET